jgi:hypothetical protein
VPPFGDEEAMAALRQELGVADLSTVFKTLSASPVASASIGQVRRRRRAIYLGCLRLLRACLLRVCVCFFLVSCLMFGLQVLSSAELDFVFILFFKKSV